MNTLDDQIEKKIKDAELDRNALDGLFRLLVSNLSDTVHVQIRSRVKSKSSIKNKIEDKKKNNPQYQLSSITDLVGFRFVCHFQEDVIRIVDALLKTINTGNILKSLKECRIYTTKGHNQNALHVRLHSLFTKHGIALDTAEKDGRYTSVHLLVEPAHNDSTVEIQIRNVFEDAWCEIEHSLKYKTNGVINRSAAEHLKVLNTIAQTCSEYSEAIVSDLQESAPKHSNGNIVPVGEDDSELAVFSSSQKLQFLKAQSLSNLKDYASAISELKQLQASSNESFGQDAKFLVEMEIALNHLYEGKHLEALAIYEKILVAHKTRAIVHYRLADGYRQLGELEAAQAYFENAITNIESSNNTKKEVHFLKQILPFRRAHIFWKLEHPQDALNEMLALEKEVLKGIIQIDIVKLHNCICYYELETAKFAKREVNTSLIKTGLAKLEQNKLLESNNINALDTFMWANFKIGNQQEARNTAKYILKLQHFLENDSLPYFQRDGESSKIRLSAEEYGIVNHHLGIVMQGTKSLTKN